MAVLAVVIAAASAAAAVALTLGRSGPSATTGYSAAALPGGYGAMRGYGYGPGDYGMMGGGYGMMGAGGYGPTGTRGSGSADRSSARPQTVTLKVKSDSEHGKLGPDGDWHDAFLPASFSFHAGATVHVTVYNYDDMPHSFTSQSLGVNRVIAAGSAGAPAKVTFTFRAPSRTGRYEWWCALPCDPYSMNTVGFMRGFVTVAA
ncbi:MAG: cupredoxin domain-containing protein, partial [Solirubrobacteraceae bacterium]